MTAPWPPRPLPVPPPDLHEAFVLRPPDAGDAAALAAAWADPEIRRWLEPPPPDLSSAERWIAGEPARRDAAMALDLAVAVDGRLVGEVGFSSFDPHRQACLVGYWLAAPARGAGIASSALGTAVTWLRSELGEVTVVAECDAANTASARVAERAGFTLLAADHDGRHVYVDR